jgi:hypothetical protein
MEEVEWPKHMRRGKATAWAAGLSDAQLRYAATQWRRPNPWVCTQEAIAEYGRRGLVPAL